MTSLTTKIREHPVLSAIVGLTTVGASMILAGMYLPTDTERRERSPEYQRYLHTESVTQAAGEDGLLSREESIDLLLGLGYNGPISKDAKIILERDGSPSPYIGTREDKIDGTNASVEHTFYPSGARYKKYLASKEPDKDIRKILLRNIGREPGELIQR